MSTVSLSYPNTIRYRERGRENKKETPLRHLNEFSGKANQSPVLIFLALQFSYFVTVELTATQRLRSWS